MYVLVVVFSLAFRIYLAKKSQKTLFLFKFKFDIGGLPLTRQNGQKTHMGNHNLKNT